MPTPLPTNPNSAILTIQQAAEILKVSTKTLRRWEIQGLIAATRTPGNQRRYSLNQLQDIGKYPLKKVLLEPVFTPEPPLPTPPMLPIKSNPFLPALAVFTLLLGLFVIPAYSFKSINLIQNTISKLSPFIPRPKLIPASTNHKINSIALNPAQGSVLAGETALNDYIFTVNVPASFATTATVSGNLTAPNIIYSVLGGEGINITGDAQNPTISAVDQLSTAEFFSSITVGTTNIAATTNSDAFTIAAGSNVSITTDATTKKITISSTDTDTVGLEGTIDVENGGTGLTSYDTGDLIYASAADTLATLTVGSNGAILTVSGGIPTWSVPGGSSCTTDCLITDPSSTQTITPLAAGATGLRVAQAVAGSVDIFSVTNNGSSTKYLFVDSLGQLNFNSDINFSASSPTISINGGETLRITDGSNTLLSLVDSGSSGTLTVNTLTATNIGAFNLTGNITGIGSPSLTGIGTINGGNITGGTYNGATITGGTVSAGTLSGGTWSATGGTVSGSYVTTIGDGSSYSISDGTNTLLSLTDGGTGGTLVLTGNTDITSSSNTNLAFTANGTGDIVFTTDADTTFAVSNLANCDTIDSDANGILTCGTDATSGSAVTLQNVYDNDVNGSDAIVLLSSLDDSIIFRNPASAGTDSSYLFNIDQLATGVIDAFTVTNAGTGVGGSFTLSNPSGTRTNGLLIDQTGAGTTTNAINISETSGTITTGINIGTGLGTGINLNSNTLIDIGNSGTDFDSSGGLALAGSFTANSDSDFIFSGTENLSLTNTSASSDQLSLAVSGLTTDGIDALAISLTQADDADATDSNSAISVALTSSSGDTDTLYGLNFTDFTGGNATETAIKIGAGFNSLFEFEGSADANETLIQISNPSTDQIISFPDSTGTICLSSGNCSGGAGGSKWTDSGTVVYLSDTTDELVIGGLTAISSSKVSLDGDSDQIQFLIQGHSTQTNNLATFEASGGADQFTVDVSGNVSIEGQISDISDGTVSINDDLQVIGNDITDSTNTPRITLGATTTLTNTTTTLSGTTTLTANSLTTITAGAALTLNGTSYVRIGDTASPGVANGDDDLFVESDIEIDGSLILASDTVTDITGTGLQISSGSLETTLGISVDSSEITDNTITATDLAAILTFADGDLIDFSTINLSSTTEGILLPQAASCSSATAEGQICWDSNDEVLSIGNGTGGIATFLTSSTTLFNTSSDSGTSSVVVSDTLSVNGGTNGIDTTLSGDTYTLNLDTTEIGTTTFGTSSSSTATFSGNVTVTTDLTIGSIGLNDVGSNNITSGASLVGVFDELANSNSTTLQDVLDDLDAAIGSGASKWTDAGAITYLTATSDDFTVGASNTLVAPLSVDVSANLVRIGTGSTANAQIDLFASDADTGSLVYNTSDQFNFTGGDVLINQKASVTGVNAAGASADAVTLSGTLGIFDGSDTFRGLYLNYTNADHTGGTNVVNGLDIAGITADAQATETAINIGAGWDSALTVNANSILGATGILQSFALSGTYSNALTLSSTSNAFTGTIGQSTPLAGSFTTISNNNTISQTYSPAGTTASAIGTTLTPVWGIDAVDQTLTGLLISPNTNSNTDAGDALYALDLANITATAGTEVGLRIGSGYDRKLEFELGSNDLYVNTTAPTGASRTATIPALGADDTFCFVTLGNCAGSGSGVTTSGGNINRVAKFSAAQAIADSNISDNGTDVTLLANSNLVLAAGTGTITQNFQPLGTTATANGATFTPTSGLNATDQVLSGIYVNANTNGNTDAGDILYGLNIDNITDASGPTETAIRIGEDWTNLFEFEGATNDGFETFFQVSDATGTDQTITIPNDTGTVCLSSGNCAGGSGGSKWTDSGSITYLTSISDDLVVGGTTLASSLSVDVSANLVRIGTGSTANAQIDLFASDADTGSLVYNTSDQFNFTGGDVLINQKASVTGVNAAGASADAVTLSGTLGIFDGSDTFRGLYLNYTNADHTGGTNVVNGLDIAGITADAQATETAINIGAGWDSALTVNGVSVVSATGTVPTTVLNGTLLTAAGDSGSDTIIQSETLTLAGGNGLVSTGSSNQVSFAVGAGNGISVAADAVAVNQAFDFTLTGNNAFTPSSTGDVTFNLDNDSQLIQTGTVTDTGSLQDLNLTLGNDAATDTVSALNIDVTSVDTGADSDIIRGIDIANLTGGNANVTEQALRIGSGWDNAVVVDTTPIINGSGVLLSAGLSGTYSNALTLSSTSNAFTGTIGQSTPLAGSFTTLSSTGVTTIGNGSATAAVNSTNWGVTTAGVATFVTDETVNGIDISAGTVSDVVNLTINTGGDLTIGSIGLNDVGSNNITSGASLVGVFDELANSNSTTLQDVLDDLDAAIGSGASKWTDAGAITYLTATSDDFTVGASNTLVAPLSVDVSANLVRIGTGSTANAQIDLFASDADTGSLVYNTSDQFNFTGGDVLINQKASVTGVNAAGASADAVTLSGTLGIFDGSDTFRGLYLNYTNADHTGGTNVVNGLDIAGITADAQAAETALVIGSGWDNVLTVGGTTILNSTGQLPTTNLSGTLFTLAGDSGSDAITQAETVTIIGGTNITSVGSTSQVTVNLDDNVSLAGTTGLTLAGTGADLIFANNERLTNDTDSQFTFARNDAGTVTISAADNDATAALTILSGGASALTLDAGGSAAVALATTNASALTLGKSGITTTNQGALTISETLTANGTVALGDNGDAITLSGTTITLTANSAGNDITANLVDNNTNALDIQEATNNYLNITTTNSAENITLGNATTNPDFTFLGTGNFTLPTLGSGTGSTLCADGSNNIVNCGASSSPFTATGGIIDKTTVGDRLRLLYGDVADVQFEINNTTNTAGAPTADTVQLNLTDGAGITTDNVDGLFINIEGANGTSSDVSAIHLDFDPITGSADDTFSAILIDGITSTSATENAINIGSNWDSTFSVAGNSILGNTGLLQSFALSGTYSNALTLSSTSNALTGTIGQATPLAGSFTTLSSTGVTTLGNSSATVAIDSSDWDINTSGALTGISGINNDAGYTQTGTTANTFTGASTFNRVNSAAGSADNVTLSGTLGIFDGSDTYRGLYLNYTNSNHTGGSNIFNGLDIAGITQDAEATETAINIGAGWDSALTVNGVSVVSATGTIPSTVLSGTLFTIAGDSVSDTIVQGDTLTIVGGTNLTTVGGTNMVTVNLDNDVSLSGTTGLTLTGAGSALTFQNNETIKNSTDGTFTLGRNDAGIVTLIAADNDATAALTITSGGASALTLDAGGSAAVALATTNASALTLGKTGITTTNLGALTISETLTANGVVALGDAGDSITLSGTTVTLTANGAGNDITGNLVDNNTDALDFQEGSNNYINVNTTNGSENITLGNATTNPTTTLTAVNAASGSKDVLTLSGTLGNFNGSDTFRGIYINYTNGTHSSTGNNFFGLDIGNITGSANATENAINIGSGWDSNLFFNDTSTNIGVADTGVITFTDGTNTLATLTDNSNTGDLSLTGDLTVTGGDIVGASTTNIANAATTLNLGSTNVTRTINVGTGTNADTINIGTGATTADDINLGGLSTSTIDIFGVTKLGDGGSTNYAQFSATGDLTFVGTGDTITGPSGAALTINSANSQNLVLGTTTAGDITLTPAVGTGLVNILTGNLKVGNATPDVSLNGEDAFIEGTFEVDGAARYDSSLTLSSSTGLLDLAAITHATTAVSGLKLPQTATLSNGPTGSVEGFLAYETSTNLVKIWDGAAWQSISGASTTLQQAYDAGNTITTDATGDISFTLAELGTPTRFEIFNQDTAGTEALEIDNTIASGTLTQGLLIEQSGAGTMTSGIQITETAGTITTGLNIGAGVGTAISLQNGETIDNSTNNQINMNLGTAGTLLLTSGTSTTIDTSSNVLNFAASEIVTFTGLEGSTVVGVTAGDVAISDGSLLVTDDDNANSFGVINNTATTIGAGINTDGIVDISSTTLTTGNLFNLETTTTLTSGRILNLSSTSTAFTTGNLASLDWSPGSATNATSADLFKINIGTNGNLLTGNLFNITDTNSSLFSVNESQITSALPHQFTAAGDVSLAYDLQFTNQTASYIKSNSSITLEAGESFENNNLTFKTYGAGNIISNPGTTGKFGINTVNPILKFHVADSQSATASAMIENTDTGDNADGLTIKLGDTSFANGTTTCATGGVCNEFITFLSGDGTKMGKVHLNNNVLNYKTTGSDFAEFFVKQNPIEEIPVGVVMCQTDNGARPCSSADSTNILGVVSDTAGFTGGEDGADKSLIGLVGQVPVKLASSSEAITAGDYITISNSVTGLAMKASKPGYMIGKALESWTPGNGDTVKIYLSVIWADPNQTLAFDDNGGLIIEGKITAQDVKLESTTTLIDSLQDDMASMSAKLLEVEDTIANLELPDSNWQVSTDSGRLLTTLSVQVPELSVTGKLSVGLLSFDDMTGDISSLTGTTSFQNGAMLVNESGDVMVTNSIIAKKYNVDTSNVAGASAGKATIPAGLSELTIDTTAVSTSSSIFVTPEIPIAIGASATQSGNFVINLSATQSADLKVNWWVIN